MAAAQPPRPGARAPYRPTREEFIARSGDGNVIIPVVREVLADLQTPVAVYDRLRTEAGPTFLLESVEHGERWGRYSFVGLAPLCEFTARLGAVAFVATDTFDGALGDGAAAIQAAAAGGDPLATLAALLDAVKVPDLPGLPPLFAGAAGYIGYDCVRFIERIPASGVDDLGMDDAHLCLPGHIVAFDHLRQRLLVVSNVVVGDNPGARYDAAVAESERLVARLGEPVATSTIAPPTAVTVTDAAANMARADYLGAVEQAKAHIRAGDAFQVVPSQRFHMATTVDPLLVYRVLRVINPSPYMYLFDFGATVVVGSSPEALVTVRDQTASIWPIAGSRPRGATDDEDVALETAMRADEKERAEHVMLVDLARNDLGRVCDTGTVRVRDFMDVVRYSHIMHLRSTVTGEVRPGVSSVDVVRATFPAGTLSGAPKVRAMEIIDDVEPTRRGLYGGGIGYLDLAGNVDLCIAIRTVVFRGGKAYVQAGAGIVADSVAELEYDETVNKAMALLAAVRAAETLAGDGESGPGAAERGA